ncbi:MAG: hypothetical protein D4R64_14845 [Porphyromonadaceae bacterium]|nr:MAG: hypothetical protein D4R64_14845 [Porphyromonadaceae bacterium]
MKLDIKIPIGLLFTIFGLILSVYGLATGSDAEIYAKSLGYNINLYIGLFMFVFGVFMLILSRKTLKEIK